MKASFDKDNNYCHYVIQRIAGFAITLNYHPAGPGEYYHPTGHKWIVTLSHSNHFMQHLINRVVLITSGVSIGLTPRGSFTIATQSQQLVVSRHFLHHTSIRGDTSEWELSFIPVIHCLHICYFHFLDVVFEVFNRNRTTGFYFSVRPLLYLAYSLGIQFLL
jgi:hypothetical protein